MYQNQTCIFNLSPPCVGLTTFNDIKKRLAIALAMLLSCKLTQYLQDIILLRLSEK